MSSGAANVSSVKRSRARRPSVPSSPSATANTLASTTITFCPKVTHSCAKRHPATVTCRAALEDLLQSWLTRIGDQTAPKVFLERLVCACSALPQDPMSVVRHIFDLHTRHGAIVAPLAPQCKCASSTTTRSSAAPAGLGEPMPVRSPLRRVPPQPIGVLVARRVPGTEQLVARKCAQHRRGATARPTSARSTGCDCTASHAQC